MQKYIVVLNSTNRQNEAGIIHPPLNSVSPATRPLDTQPR